MITDDIEKLIDTAEKFRKAYFWTPSNVAAIRRSYEKKHSISEFSWREGSDLYTAKYTVECSSKHIYAHGEYTKNGKKTTLLAVKNSLERLKKEVTECTITRKQ